MSTTTTATQQTSSTVSEAQQTAANLAEMGKANNIIAMANAQFSMTTKKDNTVAEAATAIKSGTRIS